MRLFSSGRCTRNQSQWNINVIPTFLITSKIFNVSVVQNICSTAFSSRSWNIVTAKLSDDPHLNEFVAKNTKLVKYVISCENGFWGLFHCSVFFANECLLILNEDSALKRPSLISDSIIIIYEFSLAGAFRLEIIVHKNANSRRAFITIKVEFSDFSDRSFCLLHNFFFSMPMTLLKISRTIQTLSQHAKQTS